MTEPSTTTTTKDIDHGKVSAVINFLNGIGVSSSIPDDYSSKDAYSNLVSDHLKVLEIQPGHVTCLLTVKPAVTNFFGGLHGGAVAAVAERVAIACARTVVAENKELFLGELSMSYLSAARKHAELVVDGSIVRSGRNVTVVAMEFKFKDSAKLVYTSRATFYNMPVSRL